MVLIGSIKQILSAKASLGYSLWSVREGRKLKQPEYIEGDFVNGKLEGISTY
jgi:hypothetical protein